MADFLDFSSRTSKLQKEQEKRREAARSRIQRERASKEAAARERARIEEQIRQRKREQALKEAEERERAEAERTRTGGIDFEVVLIPVPSEGEGDKVLLPPSALESLSKQDAVALGPMLFEISRDKGSQEANQGGASATGVPHTTHAGVLEFVAAEGTIGLPRKVILSLMGSEDAGVGNENKPEPSSLMDKLGNISVKYVRLEKATFAKVVPETVGLSQVSELRATLEDNLRNHATLTVGDRLSVWRRGREFSLKVVEIRPEPSVTLIDTDVEIELDLPDEAREQLEAKDARERAQTLRAHMDPAPSPASGLSPIAPSGGPLAGHTLSPAAAATSTLSPMKHDDPGFDPDDEEESISKGAFDPEKHQLAKLQALPQEPPKDEEGVFTCQLRSSQGKFARRFRHGDSLGLLLDFAEAHGGAPGRYRVVIPFPRKELTREDAISGMTLKAAGLTSRQEAVILERF